MRKLVAAGAMALGIATLPLTAAHAGSTWIVTVKASDTAVNVGQKVTFTGTVKPHGAAAGEKVVLQERFKPGAKWKDQRKDELNGRGKYSLSDRPSANTQHSYRVVMAATGKHAKGVSKTVKVTVYGWVGLTSVPHVNDEGMSFGSVDINGKTYDDSVVSDWPNATASIEFNLGHRCDALRATFGLSDASTTGGQAELGVLSDGTSVYDQTFDLEQTDKKTISLDTPLKIKLTGDRHQRGLGHRWVRCVRERPGALHAMTSPRGVIGMRGAIGTVFAVAVVSGVLVAATAPADAAAHRPPWHVTIKASTATLTLGQKVVLSGKVNRSAAGKLVVLQERHKAGAKWKDQANAVVHRDGHYRVSDRPSVNNRRSYRVVMPATKRHKKGVSESVAVDVYQWTSLTTLPAVNRVLFDSVAIGVHERRDVSELAGGGRRALPRRADDGVGRVQPQPSVHPLPRHLRPLRRLGGREPGDGHRDRRRDAVVQPDVRSRRVDPERDHVRDRASEAALRVELGHRRFRRTGGSRDTGGLLRAVGAGAGG